MKKYGDDFYRVTAAALGVCFQSYPLPQTLTQDVADALGIDVQEKGAGVHRIKSYGKIGDVDFRDFVKASIERLIELKLLSGERDAYTLTTLSLSILMQQQDLGKVEGDLYVNMLDTSRDADKRMTAMANAGKSAVRKAVYQK